MSQIPASLKGAKRRRTPTQPIEQIATVYAALLVPSVITALALNLLNVAAVWQQGGPVWLAIAAVVAVSFWNGPPVGALVNRFGASTGEAVRMVGNVALAIWFGHTLGWPATAWAWMTFFVLPYDGVNPKAARVRLSLSAGAVFLIGLADGGSPMLALTFLILTVSAYVLAETRIAITRKMYREAKQQNEALDAAHAELAKDLTERLCLEAELRNAQKLESIGRLASGVAHEINTPIQFVTDNTRFLIEAFEGLQKVVAADHVAMTAPSEASQAEAMRVREWADLGYLTTTVPEALSESLDGLRRVATIVRSMKRFAHPDGGVHSEVDLNAEVESTLTIARNEYRYVADLDWRPGVLAAVRCNAGEINQVVLNVVVNAAHAIADECKKTGEKGRIGVSTRREGSEAIISISDTGGGIPEKIRHRIYDPFFTTKEVGRGTGQGLAIARSVLARHGGSIAFDTLLGQGTTFHIRLPVQPISTEEQK
jgi:signal transduction histidine kinase